MAIGIDAAGAVYVSGGSDGGSPTGWDFATVKYFGCACACVPADPNCDGAPDVFDVILVIDIAFSGEPYPDPNPPCPLLIPDVNCDGIWDVFDIIQMIDIAFSGATPCDPCAL